MAAIRWRCLILTAELIQQVETKCVIDHHAVPTPVLMAFLEQFAIEIAAFQREQDAKTVEGLRGNYGQLVYITKAAAAIRAIPETP